MANARVLAQEEINHAWLELRDLTNKLLESDSKHDLANAELLANLVDPQSNRPVTNEQLVTAYERIQEINDEDHDDNEMIDIGFGRMHGLFYTPALAAAVAVDWSDEDEDPAHQFGEDLPAAVFENLHGQREDVDFDQNRDVDFNLRPRAHPSADTRAHSILRPGSPESDDSDLDQDRLADLAAAADVNEFYESEDDDAILAERTERAPLNTENFGDREFLEVFRVGRYRGVLTVAQYEPYYNHFKWLETKVTEAEMSLTELAHIKKVLETLERMRLMLTYYQERLRDGNDLPEGVSLSAQERTTRANAVDKILTDLEGLIERARTVRDAGINEVVTYSESAEVVAAEQVQSKLYELMGLMPNQDGFEGGALVAGDRFIKTPIVKSADEARVSVNTIKNIFNGETKVGAVAMVEPEKKRVETKLFYDMNRLKYHSFRAVTQMAAKLVEDHLALDSRGEKRIILRGNMHEKLVKAVMTYAKAMDYQAINQTRHQKIKVSDSDVMKIKEDIQNNENVLAGFDKTERFLKVRSQEAVNYHNKQTGADNEVATAAARIRIR